VLDKLPVVPKEITFKASEWVKIQCPQSLGALPHRVQIPEFCGEGRMSLMAKKKAARKQARRKVAKKAVKRKAARGRAAKKHGRGPSKRGKESKVRKLIRMAKSALRLR